MIKFMYNKEEIIRIIGHGMDTERAELKAQEILDWYNKQTNIPELIKKCYNRFA